MTTRSTCTTWSTHRRAAAAHGSGVALRIRNGASSNVSTDKFGGGNALLQYGTQLHGFYENTSKSALSHSWWDGVKWNTETLDGSGSGTPATPPTTSGPTSPSIQYGSQIQLFYTHATTHTLRHAWWDGSGVELRGARRCRRRERPHDRPDRRRHHRRASVRRPAPGLLLRRHRARAPARLVGRQGVELRDARHRHSPSSHVAVAATQYGSTFHVVYNGTGGLLRHAWYDTKWNKETLDGDSTVGGRTTDDTGDYARVLQFGTQLDIVYQNVTTGSLRHAWWNGAKWSYETLDGTNGTITGHTTNNVGAYITVLPYAGGLHIMYQDSTTGALRHAWYANGWKVEVLDGNGATNAGHYASGDTGRFTSMLQYGSQLQLTYFDHGNADRWIHSWYS